MTTTLKNVLSLTPAAPAAERAIVATIGACLVFITFALSAILFPG